MGEASDAARSRRHGRRCNHRVDANRLRLRSSSPSNRDRSSNAVSVFAPSSIAPARRRGLSRAARALGVGAFAVVFGLAIAAAFNGAQPSTKLVIAGGIL